MNNDDRERLVRIEVGLQNLTENIDKQVVGRINDHGNRLRALEVYKTKVAMIGSIAFGIAMLSKETLNGWIKRKIGLP